MIDQDLIPDDSEAVALARYVVTANLPQDTEQLIEVLRVAWAVLRADLARRKSAGMFHPFYQDEAA